MADGKLGGSETGSVATGTVRRTASGLLVADDALGLIGGTPLVKLGRLSPPQGGTVWAKCEFKNPGGSVKDRPALAMILAAEREGRLAPGSTIVEATSGNTGISLAMIAGLRGHRCVLVMPEDMSMERRYILRAYGADIELTPAARGMAGAVERARAILADTPGAFMPSQFENPANPDSHSQGTALEIIEQLDGQVAAFVAGVGTGGTLTGVGRVLKQKISREVRVVAVEPQASAVLSGGRPGLHGIQGLGAGFVPAIVDRSVIDQVLQVSDVAAEKGARQLAHTSGLLVGPSSGANVHAAIEVASKLPPGSNVVTVLCDSGERYLF
ncbi:MAG TPA: cysteine synthase A [Polyangiaceae bacterium]|nr:cysteine synthase A [Polyangiaceae bacterium]